MIENSNVLYCVYCGASSDSSTYFYLTEVAQAPELKKMAEYLKSRRGDDDGIVETTDEGIQRAKAGK